MADEVSIFGDPQISFSFSSPVVDVITALIKCIGTVKKSEDITKAKYAEIQGALKGCDMVLKSHERDFAAKMLRQEENLSKLYSFLKMMLDGVKNPQNGNGELCRDVSIKLLSVIESVSADGPKMVNLIWNL